MRRLSRLASALCLILTACSANSTEINPKLVCESWKPIYPSRKDVLTPGTKEQMAGNNAANESVCGKRLPQKPVASHPKGGNNG